MKKLLIGLMLLLMAVPVVAQFQILYKDDFTIQYDLPDPVPNLLPGESIVYRIWLWDMAQGPPLIAGTGGWLFSAETPTLEQFVITPQDPRREYAVGIQQIHIRADSIESLSDFAVSTEVADVDPAGYPGVPFTYAPATLLQLGKVRNLRDSGTP